MGATIGQGAWMLSLFNNADFNRDGAVDLLDLDILDGNWQMSGLTQTEGDANGDGSVDLLDLDILGANWEGSAAFAAALSTSAVPEPTSLAVLEHFHFNRGVWPPANRLVARRLKQAMRALPMETDAATGRCSKAKRYEWIGTALGMATLFFGGRRRKV